MQQFCPPGSYLGDWCACGLLRRTDGKEARFIVTEGKSTKTEVCPLCGNGAIYQRVGKAWVAARPCA